MEGMISEGKWIFIGNLMQKFVTFGLNQSLIFFVGPELIGLSAIQLELFLSTIIFLSREGVRMSLLKKVLIHPNNKSQFQKFINLSWLPAILVLLISIILIPNISKNVKTHILLMYCLGAFLEVIGEPCINFCQSHGRLSLKAQAETIGITCRSITVFLCLVYFQLDSMSFGIAQIVYGAAYLCTLLVRSKSVCDISSITLFLARKPEKESLSESENKEESKNNELSSLESLSFLPYSIRFFISQYFDLESFSTSVFGAGSLLLKHVLTESDKISLTLFASPLDQGVYASAMNYVSLVPRMFFLPLEDTTRVQCSQILAQIRSQQHALVRENESARGGKKSEAVREGEGETLLSLLHSLHSLRSSLCQVLRGLLLLGLMFLCTGTPYVPLLPHLLSRGRPPSPSPSPSLWQRPDFILTLQASCPYLLLLGLNGVSEAFVQAALSALPSPSDFQTLNFGYVMSTVVYSVSVPLLLPRVGSAGLVGAGCLSVLVRIACSWTLIWRVFVRIAHSSSHSPSPHPLLVPFLSFPLTSILPSPLYLLCIALSFSVARYSSLLFHASLSKGWGEVLRHVCVGGVSALLLVVGKWLSGEEGKEDLLQVLRIFRLTNRKSNREDLRGMKND